MKKLYFLFFVSGFLTINAPDYNAELDRKSYDFVIESEELAELTNHLKEKLDTFFNCCQGVRLEFTLNENSIIHKVGGKAICNLSAQSIGPKTVYSSNNGFKEFLQGNIPPLFENDHTLAFMSLSKSTLLVIPKGPYVTINDFLDKATTQEKSSFWSMVKTVAVDLKAKKQRYTLASHVGSAAYQTVPHFHLRFEFH